MHSGGSSARMVAATPKIRSASNAANSGAQAVAARREWGRCRATCGPSPRRPPAMSAVRGGVAGARDRARRTGFPPPRGLLPAAPPAWRWLPADPPARSRPPRWARGIRALSSSYSSKPITRADVAGRDEALHAVGGRAQNQPHGRRHQHVRDQHGEIRQPFPLRLPDRHGVGGRGGFKADAEEDHLALPDSRARSARPPWANRRCGRRRPRR